MLSQMKRAIRIIIFFTLTCILMSSIVKADTYKIIVEQINPSNKIYAQQCASGKTWCNLPLQLYGKTSDKKLVMMDVQILGSEVNLQFNWEGKYLLTSGGNSEFRLLLPHEGVLKKEINLFIPSADSESEPREGLRKKPVIRRRPVLHVADIELSIVPQGQTE